MSLKSILSHNTHSGQQRSRNPNSDSSEEFRRAFSENHSTRTSDDANEHFDVVKPFKASSNTAFGAEQQPYRARRRSSVQILDKKFIQSLSNQLGSSQTTDSDSIFAANASEDVCES